MTEETNTNEQELVAEVAADTMRGDLVSMIIDELKAAPDCWQKLSQTQQDDVIWRVTQRIETNVREVVRIIAAGGRKVITASLDQITAKDGIKAVCVLSKHDANRHELLDSVGKAVLIVVADAQQYHGGDIPRGEADQPVLDGIDSEDVPVADNTLAAAA